MRKRTKLLEDPREAAELLRRGCVVAFPTETVYGLGANALDEEAIQRVFEAKGRPSNNPLIVHVSAPEQWPRAAREISVSGRALFEAFSPGPITVVLPKLTAIASIATAGLDTVGVRVPDQSLACQMLEHCALPIAAPSANVSGRPSCTTWQSVLEDLDGRIDAVLKGPPPTIGVESTVVDCTGPQPILLRPGGISLEQLQSVVPETISLRPAASSKLAAKSPGLLHPHYQPVAKVHLIEADEWTPAAIARFASQLPAGEAYVTLGIGCEISVEQSSAQCATDLVACYHFPTVDQFARHYYESLRRADRLGAKHIVVQLATGNGPLVSALRDRQMRSAES